MSGSDVTARDRVWASIIAQNRRFRVADVQEAIDSHHRPSTETIRRVLRAGTELGIIDHNANSTYYRFVGDPMVGFPDLSPTEIIDQAAPGRIDISNGLITSVEGISSEERSMTRAQMGQMEGHHIPINSSRRRQLWKTAFLNKYSDDHIAIVNQITDKRINVGTLIDILPRETETLALAEYREEGLLDQILDALYRAHRPALEYRRIDTSDQ